MSELKRCQRCGNDRIGVDVSTLHNDRYIGEVKCYICGVSVMSGIEPTYQLAKKSAIEAWNRMASDVHTGL